ncbi:unnamed protein product, partial [Meganyctiphanes norvegica]
HRGILSWLYKSYDFMAVTLAVCPTCGKSLMRHGQNYRNRKSGSGPKKQTSIVHWNYNLQCPIFDEEGNPIRPSISSKRAWNGRFRSAQDQLASNEKVYPALIPADTDAKE